MALVTCCAVEIGDILIYVKHEIRKQIIYFIYVNNYLKATAR